MPRCATALLASAAREPTGSPQTVSDEKSPSPSLLIADDDAFIRSALDAQLSRDFQVVGAACDPDEAIALAERHQPDVAVVDVDMPSGGGLRATREIRQRAPKTAVVALSADESRSVVIEMLEAGAMSYVRKGAPPDELAATLQQAIAAHRSSDGEAAR